MVNKIRINVEMLDENDKVIGSEIIKTMRIKKPQTLLDVGYRHSEQIEILQALQDALLNQQSVFFHEDIEECPKCHSKLAKKGYTKSDFNAVFTDHKVKVSRLYCTGCDWKSIPSILSLFGTTVHPELSKLQCENAATRSYRDAAKSLNQVCNGTRRVNNHDRIKHTCETVGNYASINPIASSEKVRAARQLCLQVDGGHVKSKSPDKRSFEVLTSVVFKPENIDTTYSYEEQDDGELALKYKRGKLTSKQCAASALSDNLAHIKAQTIVAAQKEGLTKNTHVTALCDGAKNCWQVVNALEEKARKVTRILDWFHIAMKFQNLSLKDAAIQENAKHAKWFLWRGKPQQALKRLNEVLLALTEKKEKVKIKSLITYIKNNEEHIVNYEKRKEQGKCFTSHLAESNVESLINQRCKGQQHMRWTREGLHPLMQIRSLIASNDWCRQWEQTICGATLRAA
ncbi:MAG TPA: ISKra4 family transposase [Candidatus Thioglobus sp.]|nr:ISKra4 family transposase [Candidatus Thioglobus sp.]